MKICKKCSVATSLKLHNFADINLWYQLSYSTQNKNLANLTVAL